MRPLHEVGIDLKHLCEAPTPIGMPEGSASFVFGAQEPGSNSSTHFIISAPKHKPSMFECPTPTAQHLLYPKGERLYSLPSKWLETKGKTQVRTHVRFPGFCTKYVTRETLVLLTNAVNNYKSASY